MTNDWQYSTYSKIYPEVKENFPFTSPREHQLETISEIKEAIDNGYKYIVLEAGTGTGKSVIAATLASMYESTYILTVTKQLQDQYLNDFKDLGFKLVKGRGNFNCKKYHEDNLDNSCDEGRCILEGYRCEYSLNRNHEKITRENTCNYYFQKFVAMNSSVVISNYPYMFLELNYVEDFKKRELMIFDEAHNLENTIMNQLKLEFKKKELKEYGIDFSIELVNKLEQGDYTDWIRFIKRVQNNYSRELDKIKNFKDTPGINEKISFIKLRIKDCKLFINHIEHDPSKWIFDYNSFFGILEFKPIKVDKYAKNNLFKYGDICIFMSATILDYKLFAKWLGINEDEIYAVRRESPFKVDRNPIITYDEFNMSYGNLSKTAPKTIDAIKEILNNHAEDKGIIHAISHQCKTFLKHSLEASRIIDHNTYNRTKQLEKFKKSKEPLVLISPSMNEGVDLPGNQCRFQIIYKIPYPSLGDKQTRERANLDNQWYDYKTALALVQTYGRGMRYEKDYCKTYFIDNRLKSFVMKDMVSNNFLPNFFRNAINITPAVIDYDEKVVKESTQLKKELIKQDLLQEDIESVYLKEDENLDLQDENEELIQSNNSYYDNVNLKYELTIEGNKLLKSGYFTQAIEFYNDLKNHELFINDYHPYLKLSKAYRGAEQFNKEVEIITNFFKSGRYCRNNTVKWFKKRLTELDEMGYYDISEFDELEKEYKHYGGKNRKLSKIPVPFASDIKGGLKNINKNPSTYDPSNFDEFLKFDDNLSYDDKIKFKYKLINKGYELMDKRKYVKAIAYYKRLLTHELFINDYHPYLKLASAYSKDKQKFNSIEVLTQFFKSGIYCNEEKLKVFKRKLKYFSNYGLFDPLEIKKLEKEFYVNGALNKSRSNQPVPISIKIKKYFENDDIIDEINDDKVENEPSSASSLDKKYSISYFNNLANEIYKRPDYVGYTDLTKRKDDDFVSFDNYNKINEKADLKNKGKLLEKENKEGAIKFYDTLKDHELFVHDYYPYRRQCIIFKNHIKNDEKDWQTILELFSKSIYLNKYQYTWLNNKIIELIEKLHIKQEDIDKIKRLLENYDINKLEYEKIQNTPVPIAERIFKDENGVKVISQEKYNFIENIHYINELGVGYIRRGEYETAIIFYHKMLNQKNPYFKYQAYKNFGRIFKEMKNSNEFKRLYEKYSDK